MKRLYMMAVAVPALALVAAAQDATRKTVLRQELDDTVQAKLKAELDAAMGQMKVVSLSGAAMGPTVKGAPYSAVEVSESNQVLADGTRIHNESRTTVYRDSEGRVRRETPNQTTIMDPVAQVSYFLNPKTMTATRATLSMPRVFTRTMAGGAGGSVGVAGGTFADNATFEVRTRDGATSMTVNGKPVDPSEINVEYHAIHADGVPIEEHMAKMKSDMAVAMGDMDKMKAEMAVTAGAGGMLRTRISNPAKGEPLGTQNMEGVNADGTRFTTTLDAGAVGNDRPIQMLNERWYSKELQTVVMTKHSDPRSGEEIFRLTNVSRSEPGADLFQVPTSYQLVDRK